MKRILALACVALVSLGFVRAQQSHPYRVVFDLTSRDTLEQKAVLRWLKEVSTSAPDAKMEVVMYAKGFELVMTERSPFAAEVKEALKNPNIAFRVCAIALPRSAAPSTSTAGRAPARWSARGCRSHKGRIYVSAPALVLLEMVVIMTIPMVGEGLARASPPRREVADHPGDEFGTLGHHRPDVIGVRSDRQFRVRERSVEADDELERDQAVAVACEEKHRRVDRAEFLRRETGIVEPHRRCLLDERAPLLWPPGWRDFTSSAASPRRASTWVRSGAPASSAPRTARSTSRSPESTNSGYAAPTISALAACGCRAPSSSAT